MEPEIKIMESKKLAGQRMQMTYANDRTGELWRSFMQRRKEIQHSVGTDLYSVNVYPAQFDFSHFDPNLTFEKWAATEVPDFNRVPDSMERFILPAGLYAAFIHKGAAVEGIKTFGYIFGTWLPQSGYVLDQRPHFEILGEKYKNNDPSSEEEIWIPVRMK